MTGFAKMEEDAGFSDRRLIQQHQHQVVPDPDMDDLESVLLKHESYDRLMAAAEQQQQQQQQVMDPIPTAAVVNIPEILNADSQDAADGEGEFRSRCNTWPKREQLSTLNMMDQQQLQLQQLQQQQQQQQLPFNSDQLPQPDQHEGFPSPSGPLPLVCEEDSTAMEAEPTEDPKTEPEPANSSPPSGLASTTTVSKSGARRNPWGNLSYADLITQAINSAPEKRLTLAQIYDWLVKNVPYFAARADSVSSIGWKNSIRHNLSLHSRFVRVQNEGAGKSSWWMVDTEAAAAKQAQPSSGHHHHHHHKHNSSSQQARRRANTLDTARLEQRRRNRNVLPNSVNGSGLGPKRLSRSRDQLKRTASANSLFADGPQQQQQPQPTTTPPQSDISGPMGSPEHFPGPFRARTSSNASSCGGRASPAPPFRPRTLSNASDKLHPSPPSIAEPYSPYHAAAFPHQHSSPNSTVGYGDAAAASLALDEALNKIKIGETDEQQQVKAEAALSEEDQASLRLLDMTLNPEASQKIMEALCASAEASGILESIKKEQQEQLQQGSPQFPASPQLQQQTDADAVKDESAMFEAIGFGGHQQQQQQGPQDVRQLGNQVRDIHKLKILEQRDQNSECQNNFNGLLDNPQDVPSDPSVGLVQALTSPSPSSLLHLQRQQRQQHYGLHHVHSHNHHHLSKIRQQRHLRHALRQQLQQQLQQQQQQIKQQQQLEELQELSARLQQESASDLATATSGMVLGPLSIGCPPSSFVGGDHLSDDANGCGGALTPVTESANEDASAATNEFYEDFLRFTQGDDSRPQQQQQQPEPPPQTSFSQQQQQQQQRGRLGAKDEEDDDVYLQNLVDPISVGGYTNSTTAAAAVAGSSAASSATTETATVGLGF